VSTNKGEPLTLNGSRSPAAQAYRNIAKRLRGEEIPVPDPSELNRGFRARVRDLMNKRIF
jgi:septum site-determining protein MinD